MKYSVGITNAKRSKRMKKTKSPRSKSFDKAFTPSSLTKFKNFKKYNSKNITKPKQGFSVRGNKRIGKGKDKSKKIKTKKILYVSVGVIFFIGCVILIGIGIYLKSLQDSLPSPDELTERSSEQTTQIFDKDGELLYNVYGEKNRKFVSIDHIPEHTKWALLAAEDIEFYQHKGIDYFSIMKAFIQNLSAGGVVRGASTLTQQLVKTTILYDVLGDEAYSQTYARKIKEALITMQVEQTFTKDEILQMYMNEVPLGGVNYGFQAAANSYFDKDVEELTLAESAMLAGLIQSPGVYSPLYGSNPDLAKNRQSYVLDQMTKNRKLIGIDKDEIEDAREEELVYSTKKIDITAPHFVFYVKQLLEQEFGTERVERGGLRVKTTLDSSLQQIAEEEIVKGVQAASRYNVNNGAMVVLDPKNGHILAMVGSVDYFNIEDPRVDGNVNVTTRERQMGSSIKPFVYLNAITQGYGPWLLTPDINEISFGTYKPVNWDFQHHGAMTARKALVQSRNIPSVYTLQLSGIDSFLQTMERLGITSRLDPANYGLSLALGTGEMKLLELTNAYAAIANSGVINDITSILEVTDSKGEVLMKAEEDTGRRVIDEKEAYLINWMICDLGGFGDKYGNQHYSVGPGKVCGKTGTTDGPKDLLAFQYNQNIVVGVWTGNNNNELMPGGWSSTIPLPLASSFLKRVIENYPTGTYNRPAGILTTTVCVDSGSVPQEGVDCGTQEQSLYISGRPPKTDSRKIVEVCTENGLIPENLDAARKYGLTQEKVLLNLTLENTFQQEAYERYLSGLEGSNYIFAEPAVGMCTLPLGPDNAPILEVSKPTSDQSVTRGKNLEISGQIRYLESISELSITFDGVKVSGASVKGNGTFLVNYFIPENTPLGNRTLVVKATDNYGKSDTKTVSVKVVEQTSSINVSLVSPENGKVVALPVSIMATVTGGNVDEVLFQIIKGGDYNETFSATKQTGGWVYSWTKDNDIVSGDYIITALAKLGGATIKGNNTITVKVN
ncbi:MAG: transglycosylase domain-containing protein [Candidatus Dojkabacteria bacterium]|jgi:membrane peptidoglycan carboxypeptidase|nr:transglycosylase domain-containing protein [Candidatus Dojkabacteria bacterium]MDD4561098.1 transglycosylase domain-containing protein [Candidatus Dojkabacteria bacterium]